MYSTHNIDEILILQPRASNHVCDFICNLAQSRPKNILKKLVVSVAVEDIYDLRRYHSTFKALVVLQAILLNESASLKYYCQKYNIGIRTFNAEPQEGEASHLVEISDSCNFKDLWPQIFKLDSRKSILSFCDRTIQIPKNEQYSFWVDELSKQMLSFVKEKSPNSLLIVLANLGEQLKIDLPLTLCGMGVSKICLLADGTVVSCPKNKTPIGNIDEDLDEIMFKFYSLVKNIGVGCPFQEGVSSSFTELLIHIYLELCNKFEGDFSKVDLENFIPSEVEDD